MKEQLLEASFVVRSFVYALNSDKNMALSFLTTTANNSQMVSIDTIDLIPSDLYPQPDVVIRGRNESGRMLSLRILVEILPDYPLNLEQVGAKKVDADHLYLICDFEDACDLAPQVERVLSWNQVFAFFTKEFHAFSSHGQAAGDRFDAIQGFISVLSKLGLASGEVQGNVFSGLTSLWYIQLQILQVLNMLKQDEKYHVLELPAGGVLGWERRKWTFKYEDWALNINLCLEMGSLALCITCDGGGREVANRFSPIATNDKLGWRGWSLNEYLLGQFDFENEFFNLTATKQVERLMVYIKGLVSSLPAGQR